MTVLVHLHDDREAATAASPRFTGPNWTPTPAPAGTEGWLSFSRWAVTADTTLPAVYAALTAWAGGCAIETGHVGALADNECAHDRLPSDPTPPCGCWPSEVVKDPPRVVELPTEVAEPKPETPVPALVVEEIEAIAEAPGPIEEIAELEAAKPETPVLELDPADLVELTPFLALIERIDHELARLCGERAVVLAVREALHE